MAPLALAGMQAVVFGAKSLPRGQWRPWPGGDAGGDHRGDDGDRTGLTTGTGVGLIPDVVGAGVIILTTGILGLEMCQTPFS